MTNNIDAGEALTKLKDWSVLPGKRDAIHRVFEFTDFKTAWAFMSGSALRAEQMDHHPEWFNVYGKVEVILTTHDANGVTTLDLDLALYMDGLAKTLQAK